MNIFQPFESIEFPVLLNYHSDGVYVRSLVSSFVGLTLPSRPSSHPSS